MSMFALQHLQRWENRYIIFLSLSLVKIICNLPDTCFLFSSAKLSTEILKTTTTRSHVMRQTKCVFLVDWLHHADVNTVLSRIHIKLIGIICRFILFLKPSQFYNPLIECQQNATHFHINTNFHELGNFLICLLNWLGR